MYTTIKNTGWLTSFLAIIGVATAAHAGWGPDGATIKSTTSVLPQVAACTDEARGALVVWAEPLGGGPYELRMQHMLPTGDIDGGWSGAGAVLCTLSVEPTELHMIPDDLGGAYLWWMHGVEVRVTRVTGSGGIATNWPETGRLLVMLPDASDRIDLIGDGANGIYATWKNTTLDMGDSIAVYVMRIGPDNTGWVQPRNVSGLDPATTADKWPQLALAADGGAFVAWARTSADSATTPHGWRLQRITTAGAPAAGWPAVGGIEVDAIVNSAYSTGGTWARLDITPDGKGGVFLFVVNQTNPIGFGMDARVFQRQADGTSDPAWPDTGQVVGNVYVTIDVGPGNAVRVHRLESDEVAIGVPQRAVHTVRYMTAHVRSDQPGTADDGTFTVGRQESIESGGDMYLGIVIPNGPDPDTPCAALAVLSRPGEPGWTHFLETNCPLALQWYGDIALAPTGDGGAFFFWSQHRERLGLFVRRFNPVGEVVGVLPPATIRPLAATFVSGNGVRLSGELPGAGPVRLELFDLAGRRVSSARVMAGAFDLVLPSTERLGAGLYFARATQDGFEAHVRVVVTR